MLRAAPIAEGLLALALCLSLAACAHTPGPGEAGPPGETIMPTLLPEVHVLGAVTYPGTFEHYRGMGVVEAVEIAGGPIESADVRSIVIRRIEGRGQKEFRVRLPEMQSGTHENIALRPGDIVFVPESLL